MADPQTQLLIADGFDAGAVAALSDCLASVAGTSPGQQTPIIAPAMLLGHSQLAGIASQMIPPDAMGVVHESQAFTQRARVAFGTALRIDTHLTEKGASRLFDFSLWDQADNKLGSMQTRLRFVSPQDMARLKGSKFPPHMDKGDVVWRQSGAFTAEVVARYLELAQDPNPIHVSDAAAQAVGLDAAVVPGMFYAGVAESFLAELLPDCSIMGMKLRFMAPVLLGQGLRYGILVRARTDAGDPSAVRIFVLRQDEMIAAIADLDTGRDFQAT